MTDYTLINQYTVFKICSSNTDLEYICVTRLNMSDVFDKHERYFHKYQTLPLPYFFENYKYYNSFEVFVHGSPYFKLLKTFNSDDIKELHEFVKSYKNKNNNVVNRKYNNVVNRKYNKLK